MSLYFSPEAEIERMRRENVRDTEQRLVIMGDGLGGANTNLYASENEVWVRDSALSVPYKVLAGIGPTPEINKQVWIRWESGPEKYRVHMSDPGHMAATGRSMHLENASDPHNQFHRTEQLLPLLSLPIGGGLFNVQGYQFTYNGQYGDYKGTSAIAGTHVDGIALQPATTGEHCYCLLVFSPTEFFASANPIKTYLSTPQTGALDSTDIQECLDQMQPDERAIKAYRLDADATEYRGHADDRDLRQWINEPVDTSVSSMGTTGDTGEAWAENDNLYLDPTSDTWFKIDTNAVPVKVGAERGVAVTSATHPSSGNAIRKQGTKTGYTGLTPGLPVYASTTAGGYTQTKPTVSAGGGQVAIVEMGYAVDATSVYIDPKPVTYIKRELLDADDTVSITHHADDDTPTRLLSASALAVDESLIESYASSNQDASLALKGTPGSTVNAATSTNLTTHVGDNAGTEQRVAQSYTVTTGYLSQIVFRLAANSGSPTGVMTVSVQADSAGIPSGTPLYSTTLTPTASSANTITVSGGPLLTAGVYWVVMEAVAQATGVRWNLEISNANPYAGGQIKTDSNSAGTWTAAGSNIFDLYGSITTASASSLAQGVEHAGSATITSAYLWLRKVGSPVDDLTLEICADSGSSPGSVITDGTALTVNSSTLSTSYGWITFTFTSSPALSAATPYWLKLTRSGSASATDYVEWGVDTSGPTYANGVMKIQVGSNWGAPVSADGCFELYAASSTFTDHLLIGRWNGTTDLGARYDDGGGGDGDIKTSFKNNSGSTLDATVKVIL